MELPSTTPAEGTGGRLHTNSSAANQKVLNEHDTRSQLLAPMVVRRPRQRVPRLLSPFLTARKRMRPLVCSASGAVFPTHRHQRHPRMLQEVVPSTRDKEQEGARTFCQRLFAARLPVPFERSSCETCFRWSHPWERCLWVKRRFERKWLWFFCVKPL